MKKFFAIIIAVLMSVTAFAQDFEHVENNGNTLTVTRQKTIVTYDTYWKVTSTGELDAALHCNYTFSGAIEIGGSVYYKIGGIIHGDLGAGVGFDYGTFDYTDCNFTGKHNYRDIRVGLTAGRHIAAGAIIGSVNCEDYETGELFRNKDYGAYVTVTLPIRDRCFGFNVDARWTRELGFGVGGGLLIRIPMAHNK